MVMLYKSIFSRLKIERMLTIPEIGLDLRIASAALAACVVGVREMFFSWRFMMKCRLDVIYVVIPFYFISIVEWFSGFFVLLYSILIPMEILRNLAMQREKIKDRIYVSETNVLRKASLSTFFGMQFYWVQHLKNYKYKFRIYNDFQGKWNHVWSFNIARI